MNKGQKFKQLKWEVLGLIPVLLVLFVLQTSWFYQSALPNGHLLSTFESLNQVKIEGQHDTTCFTITKNNQWQLSGGQATDPIRIQHLHEAIEYTEIDYPVRSADFNALKTEAGSHLYTLVFNTFLLGKKTQQIPLLNTLTKTFRFEVVYFKREGKWNLWLYDCQDKQAYAMNPHLFLYNENPVIEASESFWQNRILLQLPLTQITQIEITEAKKSDKAYRMQKTNAGFTLSRLSNPNQPLPYDTVRLLAQLHSFTLLMAEDFVSHSPENIRQILANEKLLNTIEVKGENGQVFLLKVYTFPAQEDYQKMFGIKTRIDLNRAYVLKGETLFKIQYNTLDPLLKPLSFFETKQ